MYTAHTISATPLPPQANLSTTIQPCATQPPPTTPAFVSTLPCLHHPHPARQVLHNCNSTALLRKIKCYTPSSHSQGTSPAYIDNGNHRCSSSFIHAAGLDHAIQLPVIAAIADEVFCEPDTIILTAQPLCHGKLVYVLICRLVILFLHQYSRFPDTFRHL